MSGFPTDVVEKLGCYVYLLADPRDRSYFYVGKGTGNRCFQHLDEKLSGSEEPTPKYEKIREIAERCKQGPEIIIAAHGLNEEEAFRLEAVLIQLQGLTDLTNEVRGHRFDETMLPVEDLRLRFGAEWIRDEDISERIIYVSLN